MAEFLAPIAVGLALVAAFVGVGVWMAAGAGRIRFERPEVGVGFGGDHDVERDMSGTVTRTPERDGQGHTPKGVSHVPLSCPGPSYALSVRTGAMPLAVLGRSNCPAAIPTLTDG